MRVQQDLPLWQGCEHSDSWVSWAHQMSATDPQK
jgi:hypothetical protein